MNPSSFSTIALLNISLFALFNALTSIVTVTEFPVFKVPILYEPFHFPI